MAGRTDLHWCKSEDFFYLLSVELCYLFTLSWKPFQKRVLLRFLNLDVIYQGKGELTYNRSKPQKQKQTHDVPMLYMESLNSSVLLL